MTVAIKKTGTKVQNPPRPRKNVDVVASAKKTLKKFPKVMARLAK